MEIIAKLETEYLYTLLVKINSRYRVVSAKNAGGFLEFFNALDCLEHRTLDALLTHKEELIEQQKKDLE